MGLRLTFCLVPCADSTVYTRQADFLTHKNGHNESYSIVFFLSFVKPKGLCDPQHFNAAVVITMLLSAEGASFYLPCMFH